MVTSFSFLSRNFLGLSSELCLQWEDNLVNVASSTLHTIFYDLHEMFYDYDDLSNEIRFSAVCSDLPVRALLSVLLVAL